MPLGPPVCGRPQAPGVKSPAPSPCAVQRLARHSASLKFSGRRGCRGHGHGMLIRHVIGLGHFPSIKEDEDFVATRERHRFERLAQYVFSDDQNVCFTLIRCRRVASICRDFQIGESVRIHRVHPSVFYDVKAIYVSRDVGLAIFECEVALGVLRIGGTLQSGGVFLRIPNTHVSRGWALPSLCRRRDILWCAGAL